jgi:hypothetical protein
MYKKARFSIKQNWRRFCYAASMLALLLVSLSVTFESVSVFALASCTYAVGTATASAGNWSYPITVTAPIGVVYIEFDDASGKWISAPNGENGFTVSAGSTAIAEYHTASPAGTPLTFNPVSSAASIPSDLVVQAYDSFSNPVAYCTAPVVTPAPGATTLSGTAEVNKNVLNWTTAASTTSYTLYAGTTGIYTGTGTTFTQTGLTAGTSYSYKVTATGSGGSTDSNTITLVPLADSAVTQRDISLISLALAVFIGYKTVQVFKFRRDV